MSVPKAPKGWVVRRGLTHGQDLGVSTSPEFFLFFSCTNAAFWCTFDTVLTYRPKICLYIYANTLLHRWQQKQKVWGRP